MKLNLQTDYALRVLLHVGTKEEGLTTIQEIADAFAISKAHLMKVVNRLGRLGAANFCRIQGACEPTGAFLTALDRYTLADLLPPRNALVQMLRITPAPGPFQADSSS